VKLFLQAGHKVISTSIPEIPSLVSLGVIVLALTVSIVASLRNPLPDEEADDQVVDANAAAIHGDAVGGQVVDGQVADGQVVDGQAKVLEHAAVGTAEHHQSGELPAAVDRGDPARK